MTRRRLRALAADARVRAAAARMARASAIRCWSSSASDRVRASTSREGGEASATRSERDTAGAVAGERLQQLEQEAGRLVDQPDRLGDLEMLPALHRGELGDRGGERRDVRLPDLAGAFAGRPELHDAVTGERVLHRITLISDEIRSEITKRSKRVPRGASGARAGRRGRRPALAGGLSGCRTRCTP